MKNALHLLKQSVLALTVLAAGLAGAFGAAPATHADALAPHIMGSAESSQLISLSGAGFTAGGGVAIYVRNSAGGLVRTAAVTASPVRCNGQTCFPGGLFHTVISVPTGARQDHVIARDADSGAWSNRLNL